MKPGNWQLIEEIFQGALQRDPAERASRPLIAIHRCTRAWRAE